MRQGIAGSFPLSSYHDPLNSGSDTVCSPIKTVGNVYTQDLVHVFQKALRKNYLHSADVPLISTSEVAEVGTMIDLENFRVEFIVQLCYNIFMVNSNTKYNCVNCCC